MQAIQISDSLRPRGLVEVFVHDVATGALIERHASPNIITDEGFRILADNLAQIPSAPELLYVAAGSGTTAAAAGDTALQTERWRDGIVTKDRSGTTLVMRAFMDTNEGNGYTLTEFGVLTASSGGRLFNRVLLSPGVAKDSTKTLTIQITISFSR